MKRVLTTLLVIALVGSMMFAGFAGTAAAHSDDKKDDKHDDKRHDDKADDKNGDDKHDDKDAKNGDDEADDRNGDDKDAKNGDDKHDDEADDRNGDDKANDKNGDDKHDDKDAKNGDDEADDRNGDDKHDGHDGDTQEAAQGAAIEQKSSAEVIQVQVSSQANVNEGDQTAVVVSYRGVAVASNDVTQSNVNAQTASATSFNVADLDQEIDQE